MWQMVPRGREGGRERGRKGERETEGGRERGREGMRGERGRDEVSTLSNVRRSYSLSCLDSILAANINPSGSKLATGRPLRCMSPWQFG